MNRAVAITALALACGIVAQTAAEVEGVKYFRRVVLDEKSDITGKYEIPNEVGLSVNCYRIKYDEVNKPIEATYLKGGKPANGSFFGNEIATVVIEYGETREERHYFSQTGRPVPTDDDVFWHAFPFDENGHRTARKNFDSDDTLMNDEFGVAVYNWTVDTYGRRIMGTRFNKHGHQITDKRGWFITKFFYDESENLYRIGNFNGVGDLQEDRGGIAVEEYIRDAEGNPVEIKCLGKDEELKHLPGANLKRDLLDHFLRRQPDLGYAIERLRHDEFGNVIERSYYDKKGAPAEREDEGFFKMRLTYDDRGNAVEVRYVDKKSGPARLKGSGSSILKFIFDDYGNIIERRYCDANGNLRRRRDTGFAISRHRYDEAGNEVEETYFSEKEERCPRKDIDGVWGIKRKFDDRAYVAELAYCDRAGEPKEVRGFAFISWKYNKYGYKLMERYYDRERRRVEIEGKGYSAISHKYDEDRNLREKAYLDAEGEYKNPTGSSVAVIRNEYDRRGNVVRVSYFGESGNPAPIAGSAVTIKADYDNAGNLTKVATFDEMGQLIKEIRFKP